MSSTRRWIAFAAFGVLLVAALVALRSCEQEPVADVQPIGSPKPTETPESVRPPRRDRVAARASAETPQAAAESPGKPAEPDVPRILIVEVVDAAGARVPSADVVLLGDWRASRGLPLLLPIDIARGTSDAQGEVRLDLSRVFRSDDFVIRATAPAGVGFVVGQTVLEDGEKRVRVSLAPGSPIPGRVMLRDGPPVADAVVLAWFVAEQRTFVARATTNAEGRFELHGIPASSFSSEVEIRSLRGAGYWEASAAFGGSKSQSADPFAPSSTIGVSKFRPLPAEVLLIAEPTCRIRGTCLDERSAPLHSAFVSVGVGPGHSAGAGKSGWNGEFDFEVSRNTYTLVVTSEETDQFVRRDVDCNRAELDLGALVLPTARKCLLRGVCLDLAGKPIPGANVTIGIGPGHSVGWGRTDTAGRFEFKARCGTWAVIVDGDIWRKDVPCETASFDCGTLNEPPPDPPRK